MPAAAAMDLPPLLEHAQFVEELNGRKFLDIVDKVQQALSGEASPTVVLQVVKRVTSRDAVVAGDSQAAHTCLIVMATSAPITVAAAALVAFSSLTSDITEEKLDISQRDAAFNRVIQLVPSIGVALRRPGLIDMAEAWAPEAVADLCMGPLQLAEESRADESTRSWQCILTHLQPAAMLCLRYAESRGTSSAMLAARLALTAAEGEGLPGGEAPLISLLARCCRGLLCDIELQGHAAPAGRLPSDWAPPLAVLLLALRRVAVGPWRHDAPTAVECDVAPAAAAACLAASGVLQAHEASTDRPPSSCTTSKTAWRMRSGRRRTPAAGGRRRCGWPPQ